MENLGMKNIDKDQNKEISAEELENVLDNVDIDDEMEELVKNLEEAMLSGEYKFGEDIKEAYENGDEEIKEFVEENGLQYILNIEYFSNFNFKTELKNTQIKKEKEINKPNLRDVDYNIGKEFNKMVEWVENTYPEESNKLKINKEKEYAEKTEGEKIDYIKYDLVMLGIIKYSEELEKQQNELYKKHGFYEKMEFVDPNGIKRSGEVYGGWESYVAESFFTFLSENQYEGYGEDQELVNKYNESVGVLLNSTGYDKPGKFEEDTKAYKNYTAELQEDMEKLDYEKSIEYLGEHEIPENEGQVEEYMNHMNTVMEYSNVYEDVRIKYGSKRIEGYETVMKKLNEIEDNNPGLTEAMERISEFNLKLEDKKEGMGLTDEIIGRYVDCMNEMKSSGLTVMYKRLGVLQTELDNEIKGNSENSYIFPHVKKQLIEQKQKQEKTDAMRAVIEQMPVGYSIGNFLVGAWNGAVDGLIGVGTGLGVLLESLWKDEHELVAEFDRAEKRNNFLKIGQSTKQKEPPVKNGEFNLNFDNTVAQVGGQVTNMLILLSGAGAIGRGVAKGGMKMGLTMTEVAANKTGLVTYAMIQGMGSSFGEGMANGLSKEEARNYAIAQSVISSSLELIGPNQMFFGTANVKQVLKQLTNKTTRGLIVKNYLKNIGKEMGEEMLQENVQFIASRGINAITNEVYNTMMETEVTMADITTTAILTGLTTGIVSSKGSYNMAKVQTNDMYAKQWIVSDDVRYKDYDNKLQEVIDGEINIIELDKAIILKKELEMIKKLTEELSPKNQYNVSLEDRKQWSETFGTDGKTLKTEDGTYDLDKPTVKEGMEKVQGLLESKGHRTELTQEQQQAILEAHFDETNNVSKGLLLKNVGLNIEQIRILMEYQVCGQMIEIITSDLTLDQKKEILKNSEYISIDSKKISEYEQDNIDILIKLEKIGTEIDDMDLTIATKYSEFIDDLIKIKQIGIVVSTEDLLTISEYAGDVNNLIEDIKQNEKVKLLIENGIKVEISDLEKISKYSENLNDLIRMKKVGIKIKASNLKILNKYSDNINDLLRIKETGLDVTIYDLIKISDVEFDVNNLIEDIKQNEKVKLLIENGIKVEISDLKEISKYSEDIDNLIRMKKAGIEVLTFDLKTVSDYSKNVNNLIRLKEAEIGVGISDIKKVSEYSESVNKLIDLKEVGIEVDMSNLEEISNYSEDINNLIEIKKSGIKVDISNLEEISNYSEFVDNLIKIRKTGIKIQISDLIKISEFTEIHINNLIKKASENENIRSLIDAKVDIYIEEIEGILEYKDIDVINLIELKNVGIDLSAYDLKVVSELTEDDVKNLKKLQTNGIEIDTWHLKEPLEYSDYIDDLIKIKDSDIEISYSDLRVISGFKKNIINNLIKLKLNGLDLEIKHLTDISIYSDNQIDKFLENNIVDYWKKVKGIEGLQKIEKFDEITKKFSDYNSPECQKYMNNIVDYWKKVKGIEGLQKIEKFDEIIGKFGDYDSPECQKYIDNIVDYFKKVDGIGGLQKIEKFDEIIGKFGDYDSPECQRHLDLLINFSNHPITSLRNISLYIIDAIADNPIYFDNNILEKHLKEFEKIYLQNHLPEFYKKILVHDIIKKGLDYQGVSAMMFDNTKESHKAMNNLIIFRDIMKSTIDSNNIDFKIYLEKLLELKVLSSKLENNESLSESESDKFQKLSENIFMIQSKRLGDKKTDIESNLSDQNVLMLMKEEFGVIKGGSLFNSIEHKILGGKTIESIIQEMNSNLEEISNKHASMIDENGYFRLSENDMYVKSFSSGFFESLWDCGIGSPEFVGSETEAAAKTVDDSDLTPYDVDGILMKAGSDFEKISSRRWGGGELSFIVNIDDRFVTTEYIQPETDSDGNKIGNPTPQQKTPYEADKYEMINTGKDYGGEGLDRLGVRHSFGSMVVDAVLAQDEFVSDNMKLNKLKYIIARQGFYTPVVDKTGKVIFTQQEYEQMRELFVGTEYDNGDVKLNLSESWESSSYENEISEMKNIGGKDLVRSAEIKEDIKDRLENLGLNISEKKGDKMQTLVNEMGSTARGTDIGGEPDFDYLVRLPINKSNELKEMAEKIMGEYNFDTSELIPMGNNFYQIRLFKVNIDGEKIDLDIGVTINDSFLETEPDLIISQKYEHIKNEYGEAKLDEVLANIKRTKKQLKEAECYKKGTHGQGGLGGIGTENRILQNGGDAIKAFESFYDVAYNEGKNQEYIEREEFKKQYKVLGVGVNARTGESYEDFVFENMTEEGYKKMAKLSKDIIENK